MLVVGGGTQNAPTHAPTFRTQATHTHTLSLSLSHTNARTTRRVDGRRQVSRTLLVQVPWRTVLGDSRALQRRRRVNGARRHPTHVWMGNRNRWCIFGRCDVGQVVGKRVKREETRITARVGRGRMMLFGGKGKGWLGEGTVRAHQSGSN